MNSFMYFLINYYVFLQCVETSKQPSRRLSQLYLLYFGLISIYLLLKTLFCHLAVSRPAFFASRQNQPFNACKIDLFITYLNFYCGLLGYVTLFKMY